MNIFEALEKGNGSDAGRFLNVPSMRITLEWEC